MNTTSMNISLTTSLKTEVENRVLEGKFSNFSDYIRHLIRQDIRRKEEEKELRELLLAGLNSGMFEKTMVEVFSDLKSYIKSKA
jgi:antitoxin ParD1/3/4